MPPSIGHCCLQICCFCLSWPPHTSFLLSIFHHIYEKRHGHGSCHTSFAYGLLLIRSFNSAIIPMCTTVFGNSRGGGYTLLFMPCVPSLWLMRHDCRGSGRIELCNWNGSSRQRNEVSDRVQMTVLRTLKYFGPCPSLTHSISRYCTNQIARLSFSSGSQSGSNISRGMGFKIPESRP